MHASGPGCERQGEFQHLYGTWRATATHVGMLPNCRQLGLGVREISIVTVAGTDIPVYIIMAFVNTYKTWHIPT